MLEVQILSPGGLKFPPNVYMTTNSVSSLAQSIGEIPPDSIVFGRSDAMVALRSRMNKVAAANVPVLIHGESGTGKDIIA